MQDSATVGTALKTLSLRLVSTKAQLEELGEETEYACETISDYRDLVMGLTNNKVDIIGDDGQYLSTYEIIKKISEVWSKMDSMAKSSLMKSLFGARQANVGVSLIEQFSVAEKVLETSLNSTGSAMEEHSRWLESEEAKLKQLEASFQSLSNTVVNSDFIKFLTDSATGALNILDGIISKFGTLQTLLPIIMGSLSAFKNVGRAKMSALKREYADCNVVVTRNELMIA